ncbi:MAG: nucleoside-diphosphate kinase [Candidatus Nomurabacteria bacterium]|jgi:nucleoside-diphosphate kinase|nr:nucleoside-diphosphate kinase [Candidatus Nomurabacteria bacterium]
MAEETYTGKVERTLVVFKPDSVQRGIVGELMSRFERVGLKINGIKMTSPDRDHLYHHYEVISKMASRWGEKALDGLVSYMMEGPVIAMVLEGVEAIEVVRKVVGPTDPKKADMGTIRGDYSHVALGYMHARKVGLPNLIHASGNTSEAEQEINHWFRPDELYDYPVLAEKYSR